MSNPENPDTDNGPWRVHACLELIDETIAIHRGLKRALVNKLNGLNPLAYDQDSSFYFSFVIPDGDSTGHEFAHKKLAELAGILPPTTLGKFEIYQGHYPEPFTPDFSN